MIALTHGLMGNQKLLCDELPNVLAAFSFRKLSSTYSGPCFRVKRVSDSAETDINFSGLYADIASFTSFIGASTGKITVWYDQIATGDLFNIDESVGFQPQVLVATVSGQSKLAIRFAGAQALTGGFSGSTPANGDLSVNTVTANVLGNSVGQIAGFGELSPQVIRSNYIISNKYYSVAGGGASNFDTTVSETTAATFTTRFNRNDIPGNLGNITAYVNSVKKVDASSVPLSSIISYNLNVGIANAGMADFFTGDIVEIVRSNGIWTEANILAKQANQQSYYNL